MRDRLELVRLESVEQRLRAYYDGASKGRRLAGWKARDLGPEGTSLDLALLRQRARDLGRNNPFACSALGALVADVIGEGIRARIVNRSTGKPVRAVAERWRRWAESTECDADGNCDLYGLQALAMRTLAESGEVLIRRRIRSASFGLSTPMQLQVIEPDYLDASRDGRLDNGNRIVGGIEVDRRGQRVAYHLRTEHPATTSVILKHQTVRVPASEVLHLFRVERPGQMRGVTWLAPVITRLRLLDDYEDAALERARVAACFGAFIYEPDGPGAGPLVSSASDASTALTERIEPGLIQHLGPGQDIRFGQPPQNGDYPDFVRSQLRAIAAGLGMPYEVLAADLSQTNYSSMRGGWLQYHRRIVQWRWHILIPVMCQGVWSWWTEVESIASGPVSDRLRIEWTPPTREMIDPAKEITAMVQRIRAGLVSWAEAVREQGYDPDDVLAEIAAYQERADELGVVLDVDARRSGQAGGQGQADDGASDGASGESDAQA
jgi:lambda family phage portal protein